MRWNDGFIAVDWGTTNRRAYRIDPAGECVATVEDTLGILSVPPGGFPSAIQDLRDQLGDYPMLLAGMVGSTRGWIEAPYVACPAGPADLVANLCWAEPDRIAIVPGLSFLAPDHADVMRGEEIQMFGALAAGLVPDTCLVCHPGTHNKWVSLHDGRVTTFRTVMTGEMFNLLRGGGILADMLGDDVVRGPDFDAGLRRGLTAPALTAELFSVRARVLLGDLAASGAASFTSGLLIGTDLSVGLTLADGAPIMIMGRPELTSLYAAGAEAAGQAAKEVDGATAFLAGAVAIARTIQ
jgi:2-dehydro-3-deoxygalactonokinase